MIKAILRLSILSISITCIMHAQNVQANKNPAGIPLGSPEKPFVAFANFSAVQCSAMPTEAQATATLSTYYVLDTDVAGSLGIHWIGTVSGTGEAKDVVLVREFRRYASCEATDGSGTVEYGQVLRATVLVTANDLSAEVNFAIVAASATLKKRSSQVLIENSGFIDPQVNVAAQEAMSAVAESGLTVVTFSKFTEKLEVAFSAAQKSPLASPLQKVAFVPQTDQTSVLKSVATAFGLQCLSEKQSCAEAMAHFPVRGQESDAAIRDIYNLVTNSCGTVSDIQKAQAQAMLGKIRVQPKCH